MKGELRVILFGRFKVQYGDQNVNGLEAGKLQELLAYLFLHQNHSHNREQLAGMLWDASSTAQSKKYLRQALWQIQAALNPYMEENARLLLLEGDWIRLNPECNCWLDITHFAQLYQATQELPGQRLDASSAEALKSALRLYRGDLLEGWYQDWCLFQREHLQNLYLMILFKLMCYCEVHAEYETGIGYGMNILHKNPAQERAHRQLMRLYYLIGDRSAALHQHATCTEVLKRELGVKPSKQTEALYQQICRDQLTPDLPPPTEAGVNTLVMSVLQRVQQLQTALDEVREQLEGYSGSDWVDKPLQDR